MRKLLLALLLAAAPALAQVTVYPPSYVGTGPGATLPAGTAGQVPLYATAGTTVTPTTLTPASVGAAPANQGWCAAESANGRFHPACYAAAGSGNTLVTQADSAFNAAVAYMATGGSQVNGATVDLGHTLWPVCNLQQGWVLPHASGGAGISIAGSEQVGAGVTLQCAVARTTLPSGSQPGSTVSQAFLWEPVPATYSLTSYHDHDFVIDANSQASACMDMEGSTYVSSFENLACNGAAGDGTATANSIRFGNSAYPNQSWTFQAFLSNIVTAPTGSAGTGAALTATSAGGGAPAFTVTAGGSGYSANTIVYLDGSTATAGAACTNMGPYTPTIASGAITAVTGAGTCTAGATLYVHVYDPVQAIKYGMYLDRITDSTFKDLQPSNGTLAGLYLTGGNDTVIHPHTCCYMPDAIIDNGSNTYSQVEPDTVGQYGMRFTANSSSSVVATQFEWNASEPGAGGYYFDNTTTNVKIIGDNCSTTQTAGGYSQVVTSGGNAALPSNLTLVGATNCSTNSPVTSISPYLLAQAIFGGTNAGSGLTFRASNAGGGANTGNLSFQGANGNGAFTVVPNGDTYFGSFASAAARSLFMYEGSNGTAGCAPSITADYNQIYFNNPCGSHLFGLGSGSTVNTTNGATTLASLTTTGPTILSEVASTIRTVSAATTLTATDFTAKVNAASAAVTVTLPTTPSQGQVVNITKTDTSANAVTVAAQAGATINGNASVTISSQYAAYQLQWDSASSSWTIL